MENREAILLFSCPDQKGIVAEISHFIFTYNGNIIDSDQHHDKESNTFFMRVSWNIEDFHIPLEKIPSAFEPVALKFKMKWEIFFSPDACRTAIFVSRYDHCLYELLLRNKSGELPAQIVHIFSNHKDLESIADYFKVPFSHFPINRQNKAELERAQIEILEKKQVNLIILARYMQILSDNFVSRFPNQIINIHHSFLPAFEGAKPYHQAFNRGVKIIGASSHYVTAELDKGPIIEQDVTRISHKDSIPDIVRKGKNLEKIVLSKAVSLHLQHRIHVFNNKTIVFE